MEDTSLMAPMRRLNTVSKILGEEALALQRTFCSLGIFIFLLILEAGLEAFVRSKCAGTVAGVVEEKLTTVGER